LNLFDKTVFGPFSKEYNRQCTEFMAKSPNNLVCKWVWPSLFREAYERTFTKHNISKGFLACGIVPVDMSAIPNSAYMPSNAFEIAQPTASSKDSDTSTTDVRSTESITVSYVDSIPAEASTAGCNTLVNEIQSANVPEEESVRNLLICLPQAVYLLHKVYILLWFFY
jgi:hypothetical protein